jgi:hypothetical protein
MEEIRPLQTLSSSFFESERDVEIFHFKRGFLFVRILSKFSANSRGFPPS